MINHPTLTALDLSHNSITQVACHPVGVNDDATEQEDAEMLVDVLGANQNLVELGIDRDMGEWYAAVQECCATNLAKQSSKKKGKKKK